MEAAASLEDWGGVAVPVGEVRLEGKPSAYHAIFQVATALLLLLLGLGLGQVLPRGNRGQWGN
jgi:hypothetical protein